MKLKSLESGEGRQSVDRSVRAIKQLIWIYLWLLVFEGALRKWLFPAISDYLLIIRDPIVCIIYIRAYKLGVFHKSALAAVTAWMGAVALAYGIALDFAASPTLVDFGILIYGVRTFFLYFPLIIVMSRVLSQGDIIKIGRWMLLSSIPIAVLMTIQFMAPDTSFVNRTTTGEGMLLEAAEGVVRPPGPFTFILGPATYYPLVIAFILFSIFQAKVYPTWLIVSASVATLLVQPISGSRTLVIGSMIVLVAAVVSVRFYPRKLPGVFGLAIVATGIAVAVLFTPVGRRSVQSFAERWTTATESDGLGNGAAAAISNRVGLGLTEVFSDLGDIPPLGVGIGMGTNIGAKLKLGELGFFYGENEWTRIVFESGWLLGFSYIALRIWWALTILIRSFRELTRGNLLPWLFASAVFLDLLYGQTSQPSVLGITVFGAGLCLASVENRNAMRNMVERHVEKPNRQYRDFSPKEEVAP